VLAGIDIDERNSVIDGAANLQNIVRGEQETRQPPRRENLG
jgi:hypothetical protein